MYFREVIEDGIKIYNSRVRLNPENPFKGLLSEASKEILGKSSENEDKRSERYLLDTLKPFCPCLNLYKSIQMYPRCFTFSEDPGKLLIMSS